MSDEKLQKISVDEAKAKAESIAEDLKNWIEDTAEDGMVSVSKLFKKVVKVFKGISLKNLNFKDIDWKKTPEWLDDDDIDPDSIGG